MVTITKEDGTTLEVAKQYIYLVGFKTENNGVTAEDVNQFERELARNNVLGDDDDGFMNINFLVLTDNTEGISEHVNTMLLKQNDDIVNDNWYVLEAFDLLQYGVGATIEDLGETNEAVQPVIHVMDLKYRPTGSIIPWIVGHPPLYGHKKVYEHTAYVTEEEKEEHKSGVYHYMRMTPQTYEQTNDSKYVPGFMTFHNCSFRKLREKFFADPFVYQNTYGSNVQKFIETEIENSDEYTCYSTKPGVVLSYPTCDPEKLKSFQQKYDTIKSQDKMYNGPLVEEAESEEDVEIFTKWRSAPLVETRNGHEYHAGITRHITFIKVDEREKLHDDRFSSLHLASYYA